MKTVYLLLVVICISSCKNYYNDMVHWADAIPVGTSLYLVKQTQPTYIEVDWNHPIREGNQEQYCITNIKGNHDVLNMSNCLVFVDQKYQGRYAHK